MSTPLGILDLRLDNRQVSAKIRQTNSQFAGMGAKLNQAFGSAGLAKFAGGVALVAGAIIGTGKALEGLKNAFDVGDALGELSDRTGIAVRDLAILQRAFENNGSSADAVGPAVNRLQKALAGVNEDGDPTNKTFEALGLNMAALRSLSPVDQLVAVGKAISKIEDPAQRAAAAIGIFRGSGGDLLPLFANGTAFTDAATQLGTQAKILERQSAAFGKMSEQLSSAGKKVQGFFVGVADKLAPVLGPLLDRFEKLDLAPFGQRVGAAIAGLVGVLSNGALSDVVGAGLIAAVQHTINVAWQRINGIIAAAGAYLGEVIKAAISLFQVVTTRDFWAGVGHALMSMAASFNALLLNGAAKLLDALSKAPFVGGKIGQAAEYVRGQADLQRRFAASDGGASVDLLGPAFSGYIAGLKSAGSNIVDAFNEGAEKAGDILDTTGNDLFLSDAVDRLKKTFSDANAKVTGDTSEKKKTPFDADFAKSMAGGGAASAERLFSAGGFGLFVRDPLAAAQQAQLDAQREANETLKTIAKNTAPKSGGGRPDMPLRFN